MSHVLRVVAFVMSAVPNHVIGTRPAKFQRQIVIRQHVLAIDDSDESAMRIADLFLQQLEREVIRSRRALEQVPAGQYEWRPHEKSMNLGYLAELVAIMPTWVATMSTANEIDLAPAEPAPRQQLHSSGDLLAALDESAARARDALANVTDSQLDEGFELKARGSVVAAAPRHEMISDVFLHASHHRGQLTVYLRLLDATVPALFGPSADDTRFALD